MILSCQQDLIFDTYHGSILDLLLTLSPLDEHGDVKPEDCINNTQTLLQKYCSKDELWLATRAFSGTAYINYSNFSSRILKRKSLWKNCNYKYCQKVSQFVSTVQSQTASLRALDHGRLGKHIEHTHLTESASSVLTHTMRQLLLNELTIERLNESKRRNVAGHPQFNVPGLFATIAAYDNTNSGSNSSGVTLSALKKFCLQYDITLEDDDLRCLSYRYLKESINEFNYNEFSNMVNEVKIEEYDFLTRQKNIIYARKNINDTIISNDQKEQRLLRPLTSTIVKKYLSSKIQGKNYT